MEAFPVYGSLAAKVIHGQNVETAGNRWLLPTLRISLIPNTAMPLWTRGTLFFEFPSRFLDSLSP